MSFFDDKLNQAISKQPVGRMLALLGFLVLIILFILVYSCSQYQQMQETVLENMISETSGFD